VLGGSPAVPLSSVSPERRVCRVSGLLSVARARVAMMAPHMSRTRRWLRLRGMTKVTAQMSISLEGCYAGPMDPRDPRTRPVGWRAARRPAYSSGSSFTLGRWCLIDDATTSTSCRASSATAPACTTSLVGPWASCRTWVGDDPNASTNLGFRTTYEN
jgi:hypothetical protein